MSLIKHGSVIGGLTLVSRIFGFVRDMLLARVLGAGLAADAYQLAFRLPNTFRRLFAEGAFSVAFVPLYSRKLGEEDGEAKAEAFSGEVVSVFVWVLLAFTALAMLIMPGIVWVLAAEYADVPGKFELAVLLSRLTFPYLALISLVSLLSGVLNAHSRFGPGAFAPVLFNITLISGIVAGWYFGGLGQDQWTIVTILAISVSLSGAVQLLFLWWSLKRAGLRLKLSRPRMTKDVRRLLTMILPATFGAGVYQISQFVDTFFATRLPQGSLTLLSMADRLNQMPLGIVGIALGTAILPMISRAIGSDDEKQARLVQSRAVELAMLLTIPAAVALAVCAPAFVNAFFVGGRFTAGDGAITSAIVVALVAGLPAYVLVKILTPGFFARGDMRTPVYTAACALVFNIIAILIFVDDYGIVGLAACGAGAAWVNTLLLYAILRRHGHFRLEPALIGRLLGIAMASAAMGVVLWFMMRSLGGAFSGDVLDRVIGLAALVGAGLLTYAAVGFAVGAVDREALGILTRRRRSK